MAYVHNQFEVIMTPRRASDDNSEWQGHTLVSDMANPSTIGVALYSPMFFPVKVHACGVRIVDTAGGVSIARDYTFRQYPSNSPSSVGSASDNICTVGLPAGGYGATAAAGGNNRVIYRRVTANYVINPGTWVKVIATGDVSGVALQFGMLLSPAWDVPENVTQMVSSVT